MGNENQSYPTAAGQNIVDVNDIGRTRINDNYAVWRVNEVGISAAVRQTRCVASYDAPHARRNFRRRSTLGFWLLEESQLSIPRL
jgi:hypothetical protein